MKKYLLLYGNQDTEVISAVSLLNAQKAGHKKAAVKKTILIKVSEWDG